MGGRNVASGNLILITFECIESNYRIHTEHAYGFAIQLRGALWAPIWGWECWQGLLVDAWWVEVEPRPVDVDDACRVCVIGHGARLSGFMRRAAWCVAHAGGGKRSAKNAAQVLRAHLGGGPGVIVRGPYCLRLPKVCFYGSDENKKWL